MAVVNFSKLKEVAKKSKETHLIDLGKYIDDTLLGVLVPIKVKSIEECIEFKNKFKLKSAPLTIDYKHYSRMSKQFKQMYVESGEYKKGITENTYFQICRVDKDENNIERRKYRERLLNILIHFDMEYRTEEGKTLWEDAGLKENDYDGLIDIFSDIFVFEIHLDAFDLLIDRIKNGITDEIALSGAMFQLKFADTVNKIEDESERQAFIENWNEKVREYSETVKNLEEKIEDIKEDKKSKKKEVVDDGE